VAVNHPLDAAPGAAGGLMMRTMYHLCVDCSGALKHPAQFRGCITVDGKVLNTTAEIKAFFRHHLDMGHRVIPFGDCDNFDWQTGCKGHSKEER